MTEFTDVCTTTVVTINMESKVLYNGCIIIARSRRADDPVPDGKGRRHGPILNRVQVHSPDSVHLIRGVLIIYSLP